MSQNLFRLSLTHCQNDRVFFFVMVIYFEKEDGAIEFWRIKDYLQKHFLRSQHLSDEKSKSSILAKGREIRKYVIIVLIIQEKFFISELFNVIQEAIVLILHHKIMYYFFKYIFYVACAINFTCDQLQSKRQTVFFLLVNPMDKEHKGPETIDLEAPRFAQYIPTAWNEHQNTVYWVDIKLPIERHHPFQYTPSL